MIARALVAASLLVATTAAAQSSGDEHWNEGRFAAAAAAYHSEWKRDRVPKVGLNAVIAYRSAGRYARARALLADVRKHARLVGELAEMADLLDAKLTELTVAVSLRGELHPERVIKVDGNPPDWVEDAILLDPGRRELSIDQPRCERWVTQVEAIPSVPLEVEVSARCDHTGRVHLVLLGERGGALRIDGRAQRERTGEVDLALAPGAHRIVVESPTGVLFDEQVAVETGGVTNRRVVYPWRASGGLWFLATSGSVHVGTPGESGFVGAGIGRAHHRGRWYFDLGMGRQPDGLAVGASGGLEVTRHLIRPLWRGRAAGAWWHAVVEPASLWLRVMSRLGPKVIAFDGSAGEVQDVTTLHAGSVGVTVDAASWHGEVMVWPVGGFLRWGDRAELGYGVAASLLLGFRI